MTLDDDTATAPRHLRRARIAVAAVFLTNGALFANLVPRYPEVKRDLELSNAALGSALAGFPLGALVAGLFAAGVIRRLGSGRVAAFGIVVLAATFALVPLAGNWSLLAVTLVVAGGTDAIVDVAQNAHALRVQRLYGRSINNTFHGLWSVGAVLGGLMGSAAAGLDVPLGAHLAGSAALFGAVALGARQWLLPGADGGPAPVAAAPAPPRPRVVRRSTITAIVALGILAVCGAIVEDAGASWGALYLTGDLAASAATGGLAFASLQTAMTVGRLSGDRVVDRFGQATVARTGGVLVAGGVGLALAWPSVPMTLVGFAFAGLGVATLIPAAFHAVDEIPGLPVGVGLTAVSWLLRAGFLLSPPIVGLVADASSLRVGLLGVVIAGLVTATLARTLADHTRV